MDAKTERKSAFLIAFEHREKETRSVFAAQYWYRGCLWLKYCTTANSNSLQISISGMLVVEASLTLSFLIHTSVRKSQTIVQCFACPAISVFDVTCSLKKMYSHTRMCLQTSSAFLVRSLSVWESYLCWLISRSSLNTVSVVHFHWYYACSNLNYLLQGGAINLARGPLWSGRV